MNELYTVEREFPVSIEKLFAAWTEADQLERWYCPVFLTVIPGSATSETRVGGNWAIAVDVSANGFNAYFWGEYSEMIPNKKLVHSLNYSQSEEEFLLRGKSHDSHTIAIDFQDRGERAWVRFTQFGELPHEQVEAAREGMESYLDNLENFFATRID